MGLAANALILAFGLIAPNLGSEFVPRHSEGAIAIGVVQLAGTDLDESIRFNTAMERVILATFPDEVEHAWSRLGTAEEAIDPIGIDVARPRRPPHRNHQPRHTRPGLTTRMVPSPPTSQNP